MKSKQEEQAKAARIIGIIGLIVGWFVIISDIDLVFVRESPIASQPFFIFEVVLGLVIIATSIWLVAVLPRRLIGGQDEAESTAENE